MTTLLERAFAEVETLPIEAQEAIATRLLAEVEDERAWSGRFASTSDEQWDAMAAEVRKEVADGRTRPLEVMPPSDETGR